MARVSRDASFVPFPLTEMRLTDEPFFFVSQTTLQPKSTFIRVLFDPSVY